MCLAIGIDIGGTRIKAALVDRNGAYFETHIEPTKLTDDYELLLMQLLDIYTVLSSRSPEPVVGIGIGVAGLMNKGNSRIETSPNIKVWIGRALAYDLEQTINVSCKMENDANCMAIGEGLSGAAIDCKHYIAITLGTGIGGAVICNGNLLRGVSGGGGEIGHITIDPNGPVCGCGNSGCIESYIGTSGIRRYVEENHPGLNERSIKKLNILANEGIAEAKEVFIWIGRTLGIGVSGLVNIFNPEKIIIGGGIAAAGDLVLNSLKDEVKSRVFPNYYQVLEILPAKLGNWAGVVGAGSLLL